MATKKLRVLSLFSGCGGMDLGLEGGFEIPSSCYNKKMHPDWLPTSSKKGFIKLRKTCFDTVFANDIRKDAKSAWVKYFKKHDKNIYHITSIVDLVKAAQKGEYTFPENIDVVTGGFPCQDFSVAGKRKGFCSDKSHNGDKSVTCINIKESRGSLYLWMKDVISIVQPKLFIAENVKGLTNLADAKQIIERDFSSTCHDGYLVVNAKVLYAPDYGIPQSRERVIFLGFKKSALRSEALVELSKSTISNLYNPYPIKTHSCTPNIDQLPIVTTSQVLFDLPEPEESEDLDQQVFSKAKYMGKHCQGQNEIKWDHVAPTIRSEHHGNIEFRRLSEEHGGTHINELRSGKKERRLTIRECARIQTFPDDYHFISKKDNDLPPVSGSQAYQLIGNAVPPYLAYNLAKRLEKNWDLYFKGDDE
ncbi:MAG: DNA (cytosine-5-)-methyltransferase [Alphaproteobacteria bacterium]|nr:DNA (cytosine-5-)-methyltransferase [Alphaproteobacteria bacterium]